MKLGLKKAFCSGANNYWWRPLPNTKLDETRLIHLFGTHKLSRTAVKSGFNVFFLLTRLIHLFGTHKLSRTEAKSGFNVFFYG